MGNFELSRRLFLLQSAAVLALSPTDLLGSSAAAPNSVPQPLSPGSAIAGGDLGWRTKQNFARLQADIYRPPLLFHEVNWKSWPGDFEGRALLADVLLSRATGDAPAYLPEMVAAYPSEINSEGYFGPRLDLAAINEQQLSGNGWYVRALCEYYEWKRDGDTLVKIRTAIRNLALPLRGYYARYPIDPALRAQATGASSPGAVDGHLNAQHGDWAVSSDTCCAFIFLDGIAQAWIVLRNANAPEAAPLKTLIDEAIARFLEIDLVAIKAQTHASLTALRGLIRVYAETGDAQLLKAARDRYALYRTSAMTEHYANTNWFGRPDSWTEPCAIIDSFMVATQLWQHTGDVAYLEDAHHIWFNGVGRGLRRNGGFGTDTCVGAHSPFLRVRSYEAYFCCTMRGGEGHARAAQYLYFTRPGELIVPFYSSSNATVNLSRGTLKLRQTTDYPYSGQVRIEILESNVKSPITARLFAPTWALGHRLTLNGNSLRATAANGFLIAQFTPKRGDTLEIHQLLHVDARNALSTVAPSGSYVFEAGPLVLGYRPATTGTGLRAPDPPVIRVPRESKLEATGIPGEYRVSGTDTRLGRIDDLNEVPGSPSDPCSRQILFREG